MQIMKKLANFIENYDSALIVGTFPPTDLLYYNSAAINLYGIEGKLELQTFHSIFENKSYGIKEKIENGVLNNGYLIVDDVLTKNSKGEHTLTDVRLGYFDQQKTEIFIEITPKADNRFDMAMLQVNSSARAEAILNLNDNLAIVHCNDSFRAIFDSNEELNYSHLKNNLVNGFTPQSSEKLISNIQNALKEKGDFFTTKIQVRSATGKEYWYSFELENRTLDNSGKDYIMAYMTNIEKQVELEEENSNLNQYLSILQEFTSNVIYRVEMPSKTLHHSLTKAAFGGKFGNVVPNHVEEFVKAKVIHKDDVAKYRQQISEFITPEGQVNEFPIRVNLFGDDYSWCIFRGKKIFNTNGEIKEILGVLVNIDNEHKVQQKADSLNNYFTALQQVSVESFYVVDVKTKTLTQNGKVADELNVYEPLINYPECIFDQIYSEDLEKFKEYNKNSFKGIPSKVEVRILMPAGDYQWYRINSQIVFGDDGDVIEIVGNINNIHKEKNVQLEFSLLQQYFKAMQDLSKDIIFHIDIKTKTFKHNNTSQGFLNIPLAIPNFVETFIGNGYIHTDCIEEYREYANKLISGENNNHKVKALVDTDLYHWFDIKCKYLYNDNNEPIEIFGKMENIQIQVELEEKATIDKLTKAMSRQAFEEKITKDLNNCGPNVFNALIFIDIDNFKYINDTYGHQFGDFILQKFTKRITNCIKESDIIGRVGGDEFVVYLKDIGSSKTALERANIMLERMSRPISNGKVTHQLGMSMGIAVSPINGNNLQTLYQNADKAVYISKELGKNMATLYSEELAKLELEQQAKMDKVTNTFNKIGFTEAVITDLQKLNPKQCNSLVCIDIADFKFINNNYGTEFADFILQKFTERMRNCVKKTDIIGRIDYDRFGVYLRDINNSDLALERANTIIERMFRAFTDKDLKHNLELSIGIAITSKTVTSWTDLYSNANLATLNAKNNGKNTVTIYSNSMK